RRHTRFSRDWSSDVCSSDLGSERLGCEWLGCELLGQEPVGFSVETEGACRHAWSHSSFNSPVQTASHGPSIKTCPLGAHSISRRPPKRWTVTRRPVRFISDVATTAAQAPVPQAYVSPLPRSQTRMRTFSWSTTWTNSTLVRLGKAAWVSMRGPSAATGAWSMSSTSTTQWGLPIERTVTLYTCAPTRSGSLM